MEVPFLALVAAMTFASAPIPDQEHAKRRAAMVAEVAAYAPGMARLDARVLEAMRRVPRHLYVPPAAQPYAYENRPLSIGHGQTISQPYIVALMTDLMKVGRDDRVLEIGTGSGYQAAVLAELAREVYTIEIVDALAVEARERLSRLGYRNVEVRSGDGYKGWEEKAPFDAIMVTAGADEIPPPLIAQLKVGGRMVIPVGPVTGVQSLTVLEKRADGSLHRREVAPVRFVPFTRGSPKP